MTARAVAGRIAAAAVAVVAASAPLLVPAPAAAQPLTSGVVVLLVPDLRWTDLPAMPHVAALERRAAVGVLSVRSEGAVTRCGDGLLELSAGTRAPSGVTGCTLSARDLAARRAAYRHSRYGARLGLLGDRLSAHAIAVDDAAASVVTTSTGSVRRSRSIADALTADASAVVVAVDDGLYATPADRAREATLVDNQIAAQLAQVPGGATVMVVGCSDASTGGPHLHPLLVAGPGWRHVALSSASTGRAPYVQLFDVTATLLDLRHQALPQSVSGRPVHATTNRVRGWSTYADDDRHARRALSVGHPTFTTLCGILLGCLVLTATGRRDARTVARWAAALLVFAPLATWLVQLAPWWRWSPLTYGVTVAAISGAGAVALALIGLRLGTAAWVVGPAVTAAVLVGDQLAGAPLQLSAPFGDNPLVAGRFHGMGNIDFAVAAVALLSCAAWVATSGIMGGITPRLRMTVATGLCLLAIVVDGLPQLGDDVGGVLALVPAAALLVALAARVRVTWRRAVGVLGAGVAVALLAAVVDYQRPATHQTHAGRFVGQLLHGGAWQVVHRKLDAVLGSFANPAVTGLVVVAAAAAVMSYRRREPPAARLATVAAAVVAALGSAVNDSGIFVAAAASLALAPALLAFVPAEPPRSDNRLS